MDWQERDLTAWAKQSLADFLNAALQDSLHEDRAVRTPWAGLEVRLSRVEVTGEASLCGRKGKGLLQFDFDIGAQLDVLKPIRLYGQASKSRPMEGCWQAVLRLLHFEKGSEPEVQVQFDDARADVVEEVSWFLREGLGARLLREALARWHAAALAKWLPQEMTEVQPSVGIQHLLTGSQALRACEARLASGARKRPQGQQFRSRQKQPEHAEGVVQASGEATSAPSAPSAPAAEKQVEHRYPWLPSALGGVGGPAASLNPEVIPEWACHEAVLGSDTSPTPSTSSRSPGGRVLGPDASLATRASELHEAIAQNNVAKAFILLSEDSVNATVCDEGICAAHAAVSMGSSDLLKMVIEARGDIGKKDLLGRTPLMMALKKGNVELCKLLLEAGAIEAAEQDLRGRSLGEVLAQCLDFRASPELLNMIDDKERPRKQGRVLLKAVAQRDARTAEAALEAGASTSLEDERGDVALLALARSKWRGEESSMIRLASRICKAGDVNAKNQRGETALLFAAHRGDVLLVKTLLELNADPAVANAEGSTALMYAAHSGHEEVCVALLEAYAPPMAENCHGLTAEQMAMKRGFRSLGVLIAAYAMGPKRPEDSKVEKPPSKKVSLASKEGADDLPDLQTEEVLQAMRPPTLGLQDVAGVAVEAQGRNPKKSFDYSRWDKIVDDLERQDEVEERRSTLDQHPEYVWKNGTKMRVML
eukprot:gb/GFBE01057559.1/.p1 GENE.gb/GFBE01057559.1/~~gb/GFBE01057559.1/.p1  ORF type:complete len:707 (+),score=161.43 gb/GFBE01057559.1/:1-2121(+)